MSRRFSSALAACAMAASFAGPAAVPAHAATYTYKAVWSGGLAETRCAGALPPGECTHLADSSVPYSLSAANFCAEAVARDGQEVPLFVGSGLECRITLTNAHTYGVKEANGVCIGAPRGATSNGTVVVESIYLPAPISVPVRVVNKNGAATVSGSVLVLGGTASVTAKFTAVCRDPDPKRGAWSGKFTYDRAI